MAGWRQRPGLTRGRWLLPKGLALGLKAETPIDAALHHSACCHTQYDAEWWTKMSPIVFDRTGNQFPLLARRSIAALKPHVTNMPSLYVSELNIVLGIFGKANRWQMFWDALTQRFTGVCILLYGPAVIQYSTNTDLERCVRGPARDLSRSIGSQTP